LLRLFPSPDPTRVGASDTGSAPLTKIEKKKKILMEKTFKKSYTSSLASWDKLQLQIDQLIKKHVTCYVGNHQYRSINLKNVTCYVENHPYVFTVCIHARSNL
jgi:hypothetical protein